MGVESIEYSWKCVTGDELLSHGACELVYAKLVGDADDDDGIGSAILYDGENTNGKKIIELNSGGHWNLDLAPPVPIYCRRGLYIGNTATLDGILVIWRELGHRGEGG